MTANKMNNYVKKRKTGYVCISGLLSNPHSHYVVVSSTSIKHIFT